MSDLTQKRGCQISALIEGKKYNKTLPNPSWIISIKDYGLYNFIGNLLLGEGPLKGRFYAEVGDVCIPSGRFLFSFFLFCEHLLEHRVCQEVVCTQLRVLRYCPAHVICTVGRSGCAVDRVRAHHLEGMNHPSGFGVPSGGGILQLQLFSRSRFPT